MNLINFKESIFPKEGSKEWIKLPNSNKDFFIENRNENIEVSYFKDSSNSICKYHNISIRNFYFGEFGGYIEIFNDATGYLEKIEEKYVKYIFEFNGKIFFLRSLSHMGYSIGEMYEFYFNIKRNEYYYKKVIDLKKSCDAYVISKNRLFILLETEIIEIKKNKEILEAEVILQNIPFDILYPNSLIFVNDNIFYIGMRSGIGKIQLDTKKITYLVLDKN